MPSWDLLEAERHRMFRNLHLDTLHIETGQCANLILYLDFLTSSLDERTGQD